MEVDCENNEQADGATGEGAASKPQSSFGGFNNMTNFSKAAMKSIVSCTRLSGTIPCDEDYALYSSFPAFKQIMQIHGKKCLQLIGKLSQQYGVNGSLQSCDLEEKFELIVEANDQLMERIDNELDVVSGLKRSVDPAVCSSSSSLPVSGRWNLSTNRTLMDSTSRSSGGSTSVHRPLERPQLLFATPVDNSHTPFVPILRDKPHSLRPLAVLLETGDGAERYSHPYEFELERFSPGDEFLCAGKAVPPPPPCDDFPVTQVSTAAALQQLVADLSQCTAIAVDVEHHSYRSYLGLTCLIQITSSDGRDYIIDALQLRDQLQPLNQVFTNPSIVKVLHGADMDVEWLQRDCGLYLVHLFDSHQASKVLNFPRLSLAYLLQYFCNVQPDKRLQLADWRVRPLPDAMVRYAQQDTHYLLYIHDRLRALLLDKGNEQKNLLLSVYSSSKLICLKRYEKPAVSSSSHLELCRRNRKSFNCRQLSAVQQLYRWRDETAREHDESLQYVLPNHMLLHIAEVLPRELQGLLACCNPVPPLVRQNLAVLHRMMLYARNLPLKPDLNSSGLGDQSDPAPVATQRVRDPNSMLYNPHDLIHAQHEDRVNLTVLLTDTSDDVADTSLSEIHTGMAPRKRKPELDLPQPKRRCVGAAADINWISPYQRYTMMLNNMVDDKGIRLMDELTESTPQRKRSYAAAAADDDPNSCQLLEEVLPEVTAETTGRLVLDESVSDVVPKRLRVSRADAIREQKAAGSYQKPRRGKNKQQATLIKEQPVQESEELAQHSEVLADCDDSTLCDDEQTPSEPAAFDYSAVDYDKLMQGSTADKPSRGSKHRSRGGRVRGNSKVRRGGRMKVFGSDGPGGKRRRGNVR